MDRDQYMGLSEKEIKRQKEYSVNCYHNMSEEDNRRLRERKKVCLNRNYSSK